MMRRIMIVLCLMLLNTGFAQSPYESLQRLITGNNRYVNDALLHADHSSDRREAIVSKQKPFAIILGCSDSRVPPEIIFDQGLGDLFVVRIAGNVVGPIELDSIDYAAKYLGSNIILVLGHTNCGAVQAVMEGNTADIEDVAALIKPAIKDATSLEAAIKDNVQHSVDTLKETPLIKKLIKEKKIECVGAYYNLRTGRVEILEDR